jgi:CheY-like chemotaxis protein
MDWGYIMCMSVVPRVLLCDDSPVERMALGHFLRRAGYEVDEAGDGDSAIEHLKNREVDAMLLDLHMPDVDGFHVLRYIKRHRRGLPVILLSGMSLQDIQPRISELPDRELPPLLIKPVEPEQVIEMLEFAMSGGLGELDQTTQE